MDKIPKPPPLPNQEHSLWPVLHSINAGLWVIAGVLLVYLSQGTMSEGFGLVVGSICIIGGLAAKIAWFIFRLPGSTTQPE